MNEVACYAMLSIYHTTYSLYLPMKLPATTMPDEKCSLMEQAFSGSAPAVSFEFFPPKSDEMEAALWDCIKRLEPLHPQFVSVTYGAGGSTRKRTHHTVKRILNETSLTPAAHLTCVAASKDEVLEVAQGYWDAGVRHIVALRGDPPEGMDNYTPHPQGYAHAVDLVRGLKQVGDFEISVAAFPEGHPEAISMEKDIDYLKRKIDAGASRAITQYFFDVEIYLRFLDKVRGAGITVPILPGIIPITSFQQVVKFSKMCGTSVPQWLESLFAGVDDDPKTRSMLAAMVVAEQCRLLRKEGVEHFHFYTLNRAGLTWSVCRMLGLEPGKTGDQPVTDSQ